MEIIPQHTYTYGDGVPAYKSGEWPGSKPSRFFGSKLILKPLSKPQKDFFICNSRHFPPKYSEEYKFKKGLKLVPPFIHNDVYRPKKRPLMPIQTEQKIYIRDRSLNPKDNINNPDAKEYPLLQRRRKIPHLGKTSTEFHVEDLMTRKKRIFTFEEKRNYLKTCKPGDKNYTCVEYSPDFYLMEGLIVGSTNRLNINKSHRKGQDNFYQTMDLNVQVLDRDKIWKNKELLESLRFDKTYVKELNNWESKTFEDTKDNKDNKNKKENK